MKTILTKLTLILVLVASLSSCAFDTREKLKGNKNIIKELREVTETFDNLKVAQGINLFVRMDSEATISVEADENVIEHIKTEISDGLLNIYIKGFSIYSSTKNVYVTLPNLSSIKASSGSSVISENLLMSDDLNITSSSGSEIQLDVDTENIQTTASSGSSINIKGKTIISMVESSSGSSIQVSNLKSKKTTAVASSGSSISLYSTQELIAKASSGSSIHYKGNPEIVNKKTSSGGNVSKK